MNRVNLTSIYIQVREKRIPEAESVHTPAQTRVMAVQSYGRVSGTDCRVHWHIQNPVNIKGNVLQYAFTIQYRTIL